jgi:hypothetical protein
MAIELCTGGGEQYLPFARSRIKAMRATGLRCASQQFEIDGAIVKVRIDGPHEFIRIEQPSAYMESGVLDLLWTFQGLALTYKPAKILLTPFVAAMPQRSMPNASRNRKVKNGDPSWSAAGCQNRKTDVTDWVLHNGDFVEMKFHSDTPEFCEPSEIYAKKVLFDLVPPSVYTGKMKLFVQALYGSKRTNYKASYFKTHISLDTGQTRQPVNPDATPEKIYIDIRNGYPTEGLITIRDMAHPNDFRYNRYLLVHVGLDKITFRKMRKGRSSVSPEAHATLGEAYILSTLVPELEEFTAVGPDMTAITTGAERFAYGWHFNYLGTEAAIVLFKPEVITGRRLLTDTPATITGWAASQFVLAFTVSVDTDPVTLIETVGLSYTRTVARSGKHIPYVQSHIFHPDDYKAAVNLMVPVSDPPWDCYATLGMCPIYCFYDNSDKLITVEANNEAPTNVEASTTEPDAVNFSTTLFTGTTDNHGPVTKESKPAGITVASVGVQVNGKTYTGPHESRFGDCTINTYEMAAPAQPVNLGGVQYFGWSPLNPTYPNGYKRSIVHRDPIIRNTAVCVVPHGDASAVIAGLQSHQSGSFVLELGYSLEAYIKYIDHNFSAGLLTWASGLPGALYFTGISYPVEVARWAAATEASVYSLTSMCELHYSHGTVPLDSYSKSAPKATADFSDRPYQGLFEIAAGVTKEYRLPMTVQTSVSGALKTKYMKGAVTAENVHQYYNGWPEAHFCAAVGWA